MKRKDTTVITQADVWFGNCDELREKFNISDKIECCSSCHLDAEDGYRMPEYYEGDNVWVCCCKIKSEIKLDDSLGQKS